MKSYVLTEFGSPLQTVEAPVPVPQGTEVLLKTLATGVCHSDLHIWDGYFDSAAASSSCVANSGIVPPITMGHEIAGEVAGIGPEAKGVKPGERYVAYPWIGCGECPNCRAGRENICTAGERTLGIRRPGGYADYVLVPHPRYLAPLGKLSPAQAAPYACSGLTSLCRAEARRRSGLQDPADPHPRRRRPWAHLPQAAEGAGRQRRGGVRHRPQEARGRACRRRARRHRPQDARSRRAP